VDLKWGSAILLRITPDHSGHQGRTCYAGLRCTSRFTEWSVVVRSEQVSP